MGFAKRFVAGPRDEKEGLSCHRQLGKKLFCIGGGADSVFAALGDENGKIAHDIRQGGTEESLRIEQACTKTKRNPVVNAILSE